MEAIRLNAGNDRNGNPRRVFVILRDGEIVATADEGYRGRAALDEAWRGQGGEGKPYYPTFLTSPTEYHELLKF